MKCLGFFFFDWRCCIWHSFKLNLIQPDGGENSTLPKHFRCCRALLDRITNPNSHFGCLIISRQKGLFLMFFRCGYRSYWLTISQFSFVPSPALPVQIFSLLDNIFSSVFHNQIIHSWLFVKNELKFATRLSRSSSRALNHLLVRTVKKIFCP